MPHTGHPPNPILKRARTVHEDYDPFPHLLNPSVHFPPSPSLTRTFSAHSATQYDRTPIQVAPNACALPARGCPGRTYYDSSAASNGRGGSLHPRALAAYEAQKQQLEDEGDDDDDEEAERTPTRTSPYIPLPVPPPIPNAHPSHASPYAATAYPYSTPFSSPATYGYHTAQPPPLVPDLSSESDESDGFASPPPEPAGPPLHLGMSSPCAPSNGVSHIV